MGVHGHTHHSHHHSHAGGQNARRLRWALVVIASFMVVEIAGGLWSGSLALLADAGHMASDAAALGFSLFAIHAARRTPTEKLSYGFQRMEVLAAFVNGLTLLFICAWIVLEALRRLASPAPILGGPMLLIAVAGLLANIAAFWILSAGDEEHSLNTRSALLHVLGDLLGSVAAIGAALIILWTGWRPIDPILSLLVAAIIAVGAWRVLQPAAHILLEGAPSSLLPEEIRSDLMANVPEIEDAHHIHIWSMTDDTHLVTLHVVPRNELDPSEAVAAVHQRLQGHFGIQHVTVQPEPLYCHDDAVDSPAPAPACQP